jgi:L-iditol 2-dehydrogenase
MNNMKAWRLYGINDLRLEEVAMPEIKADEVMLKVTAAGICSSDLGRVFGSGAYHYPITLGHEFAGVITAVSSPENNHLIGKRAGVFPLLPCFKCESCLKKSYETCKNYSYIGSRRDGAFAEFVNVPVWNILPIPDSVSFENAAMLEPSAVALHAARLSTKLSGKTISVVGSGAIGRLTARFLSYLGDCEVNLIGRGDSDIVSDITVEAVGTAASLERVISMTKPGGEIILLGNPPADFALLQKDYWQILRKQLTVKGSWNSSFTKDDNDDWNTALRLISEGKVNPSEFISHKFAFEKLDYAAQMMNEKRDKFCKVIIISE